LTVTFSNNGLAPNWMVRPWVEIKMYYLNINSKQWPFYQCEAGLADVRELGCCD